MTGNIGSSSNRFNSTYPEIKNETSIDLPLNQKGEKDASFTVSINGSPRKILLNYNLKEKINELNPGNHSILYGDKVYFVSKLSKDKSPLHIGMVDLTERAFVKGGFGKIYDVLTIGDHQDPMVFKLSRKKLKSRDANNALILLSPDEKKLKEINGSSRGLIAQKDLLKEYRMMKFIKRNVANETGLNCHASAFITYKNQVGFFLKKFDGDGVDFLKKNPSIDSCLKVINQIRLGLYELHQLNIVHRDMKLSNILIKGDEAVISDFGNACILDSLFNAKQPHPTLSKLLGYGTPQWGSAFLVEKIKNRLKEIKDYKFGTYDYNKIKSELINLMISMDEFSLGLQMFMLCANCSPPFQSFGRGVYVEFDKDLSIADQYKTWDKMHGAVLRNLQAYYNDNNEALRVTDILMKDLKNGLEFKSKEEELARKIEEYLSCHVFEKNELSGKIKKQTDKISGITAGSHLVIIIKENDKRASVIVKVAKDNRLIKAGSGTIYNVHLIDMKNNLVFKMSRKKLSPYDSEGNLIKLSPEEKLQIAKEGSERGKLAKKILEREFKVMQHIRRKAKDTTGLNCHAFSFHQYKNQVGMLMKKFDCDGFDFLQTNPSNQQLAFISKQLFKGLDQLHDLNICHLDIKLENILLRTSENAPNIKVVLSNFGNACIIEELFKEEPYPDSQYFRGGTSRYVSAHLLNQLETELIQLKNYKIGTMDYEDGKYVITRLLKMRDRVAMGILMYELWAGGKNPPFASFEKDNEYFKFDEEIKKNEKIKILQFMENKIKSRTKDSNFLIRIIEEGLDMS